MPDPSDFIFPGHNPQSMCNPCPRSVCNRSPRFIPHPRTKGYPGWQIMTAPILEQGPPHTPKLQPSRDAKQSLCDHEFYEARHSTLHSVIVILQQAHLYQPLCPWSSNFSPATSYHRHAVAGQHQCPKMSRINSWPLRLKFLECQEVADPLDQILGIPPLCNQIPPALVQKTRLSSSPHPDHRNRLVGNSRQFHIPPCQLRQRRFHSWKNFFFQDLLNLIFHEG